MTPEQGFSVSEQISAGAAFKTCFDAGLLLPTPACGTATAPASAHTPRLIPYPLRNP
jgi:hypothetical protein